MLIRPFTGNFYMIRRRNCPDRDVLGIVDFSKIVTTDLGEYPYLNFIIVLEWNLNLYNTHWFTEEISQAEYETYRDLHKFPVLKRCTLNEYREWIHDRQDSGLPRSNVNAL